MDARTIANLIAAKLISVECIATAVLLFDELHFKD